MAKKKRGGRLTVFGFLLFAILIAWIADGIIRRVQKPGDTVIISEKTNSSASIEETEAPVQETRPLVTEAPIDGYEQLLVDHSMVYTGLLLRIDTEHPYKDTPGKMVSFRNGMNDAYYVRDFSLRLQTDAMKALNKMCLQSPFDDLMVYNTSAAWDEDYAMYRTSLPDRATGCTVDFCYMDEYGEMIEMTECPSWLSQNAYQFGYVQSYTDKDGSLTDIGAAPYHFRYVGEVQASVMHDNGLTLLGYLEYIKRFSAAMPLYYTYEDGTSYQIYYAKSTGDITQIQVPENSVYEINGDNEEGFIITVTLK